MFRVHDLVQQCPIQSQNGSLLTLVRPSDTCREPFQQAVTEYTAFMENKPLLQNLLLGSISDMRANLLKLKAAAGVPVIDTLGLEIKDVTIPVNEGSFPARIYRPPGEENLPVLIVIHGGGWAIGDLTNEHANCILWAKHFRAVVINVDYRLAPEHPFPTPLEDCWTAFQWVCSDTSARQEA
jgi:acetyl esterase/lipase